MDIGLPGISGISGFKLIKEKYPAIDIIMLTVHNDPHKIFQSLCAGGAPISPQIARRVIEYFHPVKDSKSESPLTDKEKEVVMDLVDGLSYKMIANKQHISVHTERTNIKHIYTKLHVHSKVDVIRKSLSGEI